MKTSLDPEFTQQLQAYLAKPSDERDVRQGAMLLLRINSNRYLYACACADPARYADTIAYELNKYLRIRLDGLTRQDVAQMEQEALPLIEQTLTEGAPVVSTDADHPKGQYRGRRPDHDQLPDHIKKLYDDNGELYFKMKQTFETLKTMADKEPCDRYELLKLLKKADERYRANWEAYDGYGA